MAIDAKVTLMNDLERALSTILTAADMSKVLRVLSDELSAYMLERMADSEMVEDDLLEAYLSALSVEGRSEKTIERYRYTIGRLCEAIKVPTRKITVYHLRSFLTAEKARGISDRTLEGNRQTYSAYFNWLQREGLIEKNPTANLGAIKYQKKEKEVYSEADIERMKFGCKCIRDRAIVSFLYATGCRISEMVQLDRDDVDLRNLECTVLGKGNKQRTVYLDQIAGMTLQTYLSERKDEMPALFIGKGTERLQQGAVRKMLNELGEAANVGHVHPHKFRRTRATSLIRHGMPIQEVAAILGHDKLDTTMQYVVMDKTDIKNAYRKYA